MDTYLKFRDPADLRLHPLQKQLPEPDKQSPEWLSFLEGWQNAGVGAMPALIITKDGLVMDGGRRWRAARQLQWDEVPIVERPEQEAAALIVESLHGQRDMQRGVKAYITFKLMPEFVKSAESRRLQNLRNRIKNGSKPLILPKPLEAASETLTDFCGRMGYSRDTWERVTKVHAIFDKNPELKEQWEHQLLSGEIGLNRLLCALGGQASDQSKREAGVASKQLELFSTGLDALARGGRYWNELDDKAKNTFINKWRTASVKMPPDLRRRMVEALTEIDS